MILLGALEIADLDDGYLFEFRAGGPDELAEYRGEDDVIPEASGRDAGQWIADTRTVRLYGCVIGDGATHAARQADYRALMDALVTKMDPTTTLTITVTSPIFGLSAGATATLEECRPLRIIPENRVGDTFATLFLELVSIDSPPNWVVSGGS